MNSRGMLSNHSTKTGEMIQGFRGLAALIDDQGLVPSIHLETHKPRQLWFQRI